VSSLPEPPSNDHTPRSRPSRAAPLRYAWEALARGFSFSRDELRNFQERRLRDLVRHAYEHVPYYRRIFQQAGVDPREIRGLDDLFRIPVTSRADLQTLPAEAVVAQGTNVKKLCVHRTGGSTGEPMNIRRSRVEDRVLQAFRLRVLGSFGMRLTDKRAAVCSPQGYPQSLYMRLRLLSNSEVNCLLPPEQILQRLREIRPDILTGYPGTLSWLAGLLSDEDRRLIRPRLISTDSEVLTTDMKTRIAAAFQAPVIDFYDSHQFNLIAWECVASGNYHVADPTTIVEVIREDGRPALPGEQGELVGTALHSWAAPLIRFRLEDVVTRGEDSCTCGAPNSVLTRVQGRIADRFLLPSGSSIHPYVLVKPLMRCAPWVRRYQIVQTELGSFRVQLVSMPGADPSSEAVADVGRALAATLAEPVRFEVELVEQIAAAKNGKFRPYYSLLRGSSRG
jgi:phenylacetate-CoA ligase